jgi:hypothetical protein
MSEKQERIEKELHRFSNDLKTLSKTLKVLAQSVVIFFLSLLSTSYTVLITWLLWGWFAVPVGMMVLSYWHIWGLFLLVGRLTGTYSLSLFLSTKEVHENTTSVVFSLKVLSSKVFFNTWALGVGYILHKILET